MLIAHLHRVHTARGMTTHAGSDDIDPRPHHSICFQPAIELVLWLRPPGLLKLSVAIRLALDWKISVQLEHIIISSLSGMSGYLVSLSRSGAVFVSLRHNVSKELCWFMLHRHRYGQSPDPSFPGSRTTYPPFLSYSITLVAQLNSPIAFSI